MTSMSSTVARPRQALPAWVRHALVACVVGGILAMHTLLTGVGHGSGVSHGELASSASASATHLGHAAADAAADLMAPMPDGAGGMLDDCGGLVALCLAMILGVSAAIWLSRRRDDRVLWQLPPPLTLLPVGSPGPTSPALPENVPAS